MLATKIPHGKEFRIKSLQEEEKLKDDLYIDLDKQNHIILSEKSDSLSQVWIIDENNNLINKSSVDTYLGIKKY